MGKSFFNKSNGRIQFGAGNMVGPGESIELSDELVKLKAQAIEQLINAGELVEGTKDKSAEAKAKEEAKAKAAEAKEAEAAEAKAKAEAEKEAKK